MEVVEPSVHPCLRNEIWPVLLCFSGPTHRQIGDFWLFVRKNLLTFNLICGGGKILRESAAH